MKLFVVCAMLVLAAKVKAGGSDICKFFVKIR